MKWLTKDDILHIHHRLIMLTGGSDGVRDEGMLDSALYSPLQTFDDIDLYPNIIDKAIRLGYSLTCNHPFYDGNKRIGAMAMNIVLSANDVTVNFTDEELIDTILKLAAGELTYDQFSEIVKNHIVS